MESKQRENLLYLYDLPKHETSMVKIAKQILDRSGVLITKPPQIRRDIMKPMYNAYVSFENAEFHNRDNDMNITFEAMRYFDIDGKACRGLRYNK